MPYYEAARSMRILGPLAVLAMACSSDGDDAPDGHAETDTPPTSTSGLDASGVLSDVITTVAFVTWTPPAAGESWVEYGLDPTNLDFSTPHVATDTTAHEQIVLGMKADHTYSWRAVTEIAGVLHVSPIDEITTGVAPSGVAIADVVISDPTKFDPAPWLLTVALGEPATAVIYDREGDPVWYAESPSTVRKMHTARPGWDGKSILYGYYDQEQDKTLGGIYRVAMDGRSGTFSATIEADHDFVERRDGTFAYLHLDSREALEVEGEIVPVATNAIYETVEADDPATSPPTEIFNQFDDSGQALYWTCSHMRDPGELIYHQWTHANSLIPDPFEPDDYYWINYRFQDSMARIDRANARIDWEIGGLYDDSDMTPEAAWDHGHLSHFWPGGFLMFDNNTHDAGNSQVREYSYDQATKHVVLEHEWVGGLKTPGMADARRTDSGTVIINWVGEDKIQERTDADEVVWEAVLSGATTGRILLLNDLYNLDDPYRY